MEEHLKTYTELSREVKADADRTTALLRYHGLVDIYGMPRDPKDKRSRNKREGGYAGRAKFYTYKVEGDPLQGRFRLQHVRAGNGRYVLSLKDKARNMKLSDQGE
jgi:hypothetical protein